MKSEINPQESNRAKAFQLWMSSPMPMVTLVKTMDVSRLLKVLHCNALSFHLGGATDCEMRIEVE